MSDLIPPLPDTFILLGAQRSITIAADPPAHWQKDPAGSSELAGFRYHALFCRGPRSAAPGADQLASHLRQKLRTHKLLQIDRVLVAQTSCLFPCNLGPMMVVYPEGVWYGGPTEEALDDVVERHFVNGQIVDTYVVNQEGLVQAND